MSLDAKVTLPRTTARNTDFDDMVAVLEQQKLIKVDAVAPATALRSRDGAIELSDIEPELGENGVTDPNGLYEPTRSADATIASKLGIPVKFLRDLRTDGRLDLYDMLVNGLLHGKIKRKVGGATTVVHPADSRSFLIRGFVPRAGGPGMLRALLSDRYEIFDNLDVLTAVMAGVREADAKVEVRSCDLSESSMHCKVYSPGVAALAPHFLRGYRNPFANPDLEAQRRLVSTQIDRARRIAAFEGQGYEHGQEPVVYAGFRFTNSEVGKGAVTIKPELFVRLCRNGLTLPLLGERRMHLGAKMEHGSVTWSLDTQRKQLEVISAKTRDAVRGWLSPEFVRAQVERIEEQAATPVREPDKTIKLVSQKLGFTDTEREGILAHFTSAGQLSAAGVANAITSYSQTVRDPDRADELDDQALKSMALIR